MNETECRSRLPGELVRLAADAQQFADLLRRAGEDPTIERVGALCTPGLNLAIKHCNRIVALVYEFGTLSQEVKRLRKGLSSITEHCEASHSIDDSHGLHAQLDTIKRIARRNGGKDAKH